MVESWVSISVAHVVCTLGHIQARMNRQGNVGDSLPLIGSMNGGGQSTYSCKSHRQKCVMNLKADGDRDSLGCLCQMTRS
jgi:hypothetical protein